MAVSPSTSSRVDELTSEWCEAPGLLLPLGQGELLNHETVDLLQADMGQTEWGGGDSPEGGEELSLEIGRNVRFGEAESSTVGHVVVEEGLVEDIPLELLLAGCLQEAVDP